jgi:hypothetical protein
VVTFGGYDPLVESKPKRLACLNALQTDPVAAAKAYGLRWVIIPHFLERPLPSQVFDENYVHHGAALQPLRAISRLALDLPTVEIWEVPDVSPLVFVEHEPNRCLPFVFTGSGVSADVSSLASGGTVVVNFLAWPNMTANVDGKQVPITPDAWRRMTVSVPAGAGRLVVRYSPPWREGIFLGGVLALVAALGGAIASRWSRLHR